MAHDQKPRRLLPVHTLEVSLQSLPLRTSSAAAQAASMVMETGGKADHNIAGGSGNAAVT